ncbi:MFS transporter [Actinomadura sp. CNU-125]|uniref:MFS transporter n=1 Tax=Actinomadura sp. CNU-125 TaxID=1904961 RepID=UPI00095B0800|nr:MFS transporter [Actinomadura sp. CNU-125]OLT30803.1 MFS transporter [Actinomadura sp. CNU-125]
MPTAVYRELLRTPSVPWLITTSIVGRFNQGMTGLAVLMLTTEHQSYAVYSAVSAAGVLGGCISGPLLSRLADVHGHRRVLSLTAILHALAMGSLALAPPEPLLLTTFSLLAGLCTPPMTASVRAVLPALAGPGRRRSVFALESTLQELIFVAGPPTTAVFAALGGPRLAVVACAVLVLIGTLGYVRDRNVDTREQVNAPAKGGRVLRSPGVPRLLVAGTLLVGALGGEVVGVVAMVSGPQASANAGFVLACGSLGSLVGGFVYGSRTRHRAQLRHLMLLVAGGLAMLLLAPNPGVLTALLFCWGLTVAPAMSRLFERLSSVAPHESTTVAFGWMSSAFAVGSAAGSALSGILVTAYGGRAPIVAACCLAALAALLCEPWPGLGGRRAAPPQDTRS